MIRVEQFGDRKICIGGIGKLFYQEGFPIAMSVKLLSDANIEPSYYHMIDEFWNNGWGWKTIESKLRGEVQDGIELKLNIDFEKLRYFYFCLEQPKRANGGYEESREIIFNYLFGDRDTAKKWLLKTIQ